MIQPVESIAVEDIEVLLDLFSRSGPFVSPRTLSDYWLYAHFFPRTCLCVRDGRTLAGAVIAFRNQSLGSDDIYIQDVVVDAGYRGIGVATALVSAVIDSRRELDAQRIWLTSEHENQAAIRVWTKLGFVNRAGDYRSQGLWLTRDLKGRGRDRAVFEWKE